MLKKYLIKYKNALLILAFIFVLVLGIWLPSFLENKFNPTPQTPITNQKPLKNLWNNISPGISKLSDVTSMVGPVTMSFNEEYGTKSAIKYRDTPRTYTVISDPSNTVLLIKVPTIEGNGRRQEKANNLNLGDPDFSTFVRGYYKDVRLFVYLDDGIAIQGNIYANDIENVFYFTPTDKDTFLKWMGTYITLDESETSKQ